MTYQEPLCRSLIAPEDLTSFEVEIRGTKVRICAASDLTGEAEDLVAQARWQIESFVREHPRFSESWAPIDVPTDAPDLVRAMARAAHLARTGPMAAVGGVMAEYVARGLARLSPEVAVEYAGDIYLVGTQDRLLALQAGLSALSGTASLRIPAGLMPLAVCTSFGTVRKEGSLETADAATVLAHDGALADAVATALAHRVHSPEDIQRAMDASKAITGVLGLVVVFGDHMGAWGHVHLNALERSGES